MKVVINRCFGGFTLSVKAQELAISRGFNPEDFSSYEKEYRTNPIVVAIVEELGEEANGGCSELEVVDIPFDSTEGWEIDEYDGLETIHETHRSW